MKSREADYSIRVKRQFLCFRFHKVVQRHYLGEVGKLTILCLPNLLLMYVPKIIFLNQTILTRVIAKNVWDPFLRPSAEKILQKDTTVHIL